MPTPMENRDPCEWLYTTNRNEFTSSWSIVTLQTCAKLYGGKAIATGLNWLDGIQLWYRHRSSDATNSLESCSYNRYDIGSHIYTDSFSHCSVAGKAKFPITGADVCCNLSAALDAKFIQNG